MTSNVGVATHRMAPSMCYTKGGQAVVSTLKLSVGSQHGSSHDDPAHVPGPGLGEEGQVSEGAQLHKLCR